MSEIKLTREQKAKVREAKKLITAATKFVENMEKAPEGKRTANAEAKLAGLIAENQGTFNAAT